METILNKGLDKIPSSLPVIPTIDVVVFPHMIVPLLVIDDRIIKGIDQAIETNKLVFLLASKNQDGNPEGAISTNDLQNWHYRKYHARRSNTRRWH